MIAKRLIALTASVFAVSTVWGATTTTSGLQYSVTRAGTGPVAREGQYIVFNYIGRLADGTVFDDTQRRHEPAAIQAGKPSNWIKGLQEAMGLLHAGDHAELIIPPALAYGEKGYDHLKIPANATLRYDVDVIGIKTQPLSDLMLKSMISGGLDAARKQFNQLKARIFPDVYAGSGMLNYVGYAYLYLYNKPETAIELFDWNTQLFPLSGNAQDSLAEAYFVTGNREKALAHYAKAVELDPKSESSAKKLEKLRNNPKSPTELEQLEMWMRGAMTGFAGLNEPRDIAFFQTKLEQYLSRAPASEAEGAAKVTQRFLTLVQSESAAAEQAVYEKFAGSSNPSIRQAVTIAREANRQVSQAKQSISEQLKKPIEMKFTALDGREVDLAKLRGKVVLLEFWAAWSPASAKALPDIRAAYEKYRTQGFEVIGVSLDQNPDTATAQERELKRIRTADEVRAFTKENNMSWPQHYDGQGWNNVFAQQYWVKTVPTLFLLDQNGMIAATDTRGPQLEQEVKRLLESTPEHLAAKGST